MTLVTECCAISTVACLESVPAACVVIRISKPSSGAVRKPVILKRWVDSKRWFSYHHYHLAVTGGNMAG